MAEMTLNLSLVPVGPRDLFQKKKDAVWRFALQMTAAFTEEPTSDGERDAMARAMLPWMFLGQGSSPPQPIPVIWWLFRDHEPRTHDVVAGTVLGSLDVRDGTGTPISLRETLQTKAWPVFTARPRPQRLFAADPTTGLVDTTDGKMPLSSALLALGGSATELTSGELECTWYFDLRLTEGFVGEMNDSGGKPLALAAWPREFVDTHGPVVHYRHVGDPFQFSGDILRIPFRSTTNVSSLRAYALPLPLGRLLATSEEALKTYWLPTRDSRPDSLAEIESLVANGLTVRSRLAYLAPERLVSAGVVRLAAADPLGDARIFLDIARREVVPPKEEIPPGDVRALIQTAIETKSDVLKAIRSALTAAATTWWQGGTGLAAINKKAESSGATTAGNPWDMGNVPALFAELGDFLLPSRRDVRPVLPGEGISVLFGDEAERLRHEDAGDTANDSDHAQIAELGVLVRRARGTGDADKAPEEREGLKARPWRLVTGAVAALDLDEELDHPDRYWGSVIDPTDATKKDETIPYHRRPLVRGIKSVFVNGVVNTDVNYLGSPLVVSTVGSALHDVRGTDSGLPDIDELVRLSFQAVGPVRKLVPNGTACLAPPLRYGDWYQFAGFVIDRGGGIPRELTSTSAEPPLTCNLDWTKLEPGAIPALDDLDPETGAYRAVQFLRRVPVGEINVLPPPNTRKATERPEWPALPSEVVLRGREWLSTRVQNVDNIPALLLRDGAEFSSTSVACSFRVMAPALDEHTVSRWMMPAAVDPNDASQVTAAAQELERLTEVLAGIHRERAALGETDWTASKNVLPFDPSVSRVGLRTILVDEDGVPSETRTFLALETSLSVFVTDPGDLPAGHLLKLKPGTFAVLELLPLVRTDDFQRFERPAMTELVEPDAWVDDQGVEYTAFTPSRIVVEAATAALPDNAQLYDAFKVDELPSGAVAVSLAAAGDGKALPRMAFVDRFELPRERWVWRSRPIRLAKSDAFQGELPREAADPQLRDEALSVLRWDVLAALDRGLVDRGRIDGRVPRAADGRPVPAPRLFVDDRDAVAHADYLRFGCTLISRYRGILKPDWRQVVAGTTHADQEHRDLEPKRTWRRIAPPFRGDLSRLKAPKVLAVLPLTHALDAEGIESVSKAATPFLVVLDELWFREYGLGERLNVEIVLETKEIGDTDVEKRPFRVGPLPDHYVSSHLENPPFESRRLYGTSTDALQDTADAGGSHNGDRELFPVFGPFGYSLDRSGNEALANATAFIAYPPAEIGPHYGAFVRMRRILHRVDRKPLREGPPGATYALYTQPDAAQLVSPSGEALSVPVQGGRYSGLPLLLRPAADAGPEVMRQYRYLLIIGPNVHDFGRGTDLFLPKHAAWLDPRDETVLWPGRKPIELGAYQGRVLEVLLNGRPSEDAFAKALTLREILIALFADGDSPEDAPGMIRRISSQISVVVRP